MAYREVTSVETKEVRRHARQQQIAHQDFLLLVLAYEAARRDSLATSLRVQRARLDPAMQLELWDTTARVTYDQALWQELVSLRFLEQHKHLIIAGPVGVGKTFLAHALGHIACRHAHAVLAVRADKMLKTLKHARLDNSYEAELRKFLAVDLLIVDDFALDTMDAVESRDAHEIITERHRVGSMIFTSNRLTGNAYDLIIEGESYRQRLKPRVSRPSTRSRSAAAAHAEA